MKLLKRFRRMRRGMGFGVHSPYAFRFITEVLNLNSRYGYYSYHDIAQYLHNNRACDINFDNATLIFRILNSLQPKSITICSTTNADILSLIAAKACPNATITPSAGELLICDGLTTAPSGSRHAIFTDSTNAGCSAMINAMTRGHIYTDTSFTVIANFDHLPLQQFEIEL